MHRYNAPMQNKNVSMQKRDCTDTIVSIQCWKSRIWKNGGNMFHPSLDEKKKLKIAELYNTTNIPIEDIAEKVGVCLKTAYNYSNYGQETDRNLTSNQTLEVKSEISKPQKNQWECKKCGYITDKKLKYCYSCGSGPFDSIFTKIGSPGHIPYVELQQEPEITDTKEEYCDPNRDYWVCKECDRVSNTEFEVCPDCGCEDIVFAPDGNEPRNLDNYRDPNEDISDDETESNEEQTNQVEESGQALEEIDERSNHAIGEKDDSGAIAILGGTILLGLAVFLKNKGQNWNDDTPLINRFFNNQNRVI